MSAFGYKRTFTYTVIYVRFTPESGHKWLGRGMSAFDPKRTWVVCPYVRSLISENRLLDGALRQHFLHRLYELIIGFAKLALRRHIKATLHRRPCLDRLNPAHIPLPGGVKGGSGRPWSLRRT